MSHLHCKSNFPFNIFIHKFLKSDPDDLHDHPWAFRTLILKGGYWEHTEQGRFWRKPGFTQYVTAMHKHRVELEPETPCFTLFIPVGPHTSPNKSILILKSLFLYKYFLMESQV